MCMSPVPDEWKGSVNMQRDLDMIQRVNRGKAVRNVIHTTYKDEDGKLQHSYGAPIGFGLGTGGFTFGDSAKAEVKRKKMTKTIGAGYLSFEKGALGFGKGPKSEDQIITD